MRYNIKHKMPKYGIGYLGAYYDVWKIFEEFVFIGVAIPSREIVYQM